MEKGGTDTRKVNGGDGVGGLQFGCLCQLTCASSCALTCPIHMTNLTDVPSPGTSLRAPVDRQHVDKQVFPLDPFQGAPGDRLHKDRQAFPWDPFQGTPGDRLHKDKPSPGILFRVHQGI